MADQAYHQKGIKSLAVVVSMVVLGSWLGLAVVVGDAMAQTEIEKIYDRLNKLEKQVQEAGKPSVPIGTILPYGGMVDEKISGEPIEVLDGWFFCNGAVMGRERYQELYRVVEAAFGAPTGETFNLPDLRGRFARGVDHKAGKDPDAATRDWSAPGGNKGAGVGSVQNDALQGHWHATTAINNASSNNSIAGVNRRTSNRSQATVTDVQKDPKYGDARVSKETRPQNLYVNWIIRAK